VTDQCRPPEPANVCQLGEDVDAISGARWCEELEDSKEDLDGDFVDWSTLWGRLWVVRSILGRMFEGYPCQGASTFPGLLLLSASASG